MARRATPSKASLRALHFTEGGEGAKRGKIKPRMPRTRAPIFLGVHARLVFPDPGEEEAVLNLMRRFSNASRFAYISSSRWRLLRRGAECAPLAALGSP